MWYLLQPEQGVRDQEVPHLVAAEIEDQRAPLAVLALARVRVLVEGRAVEVDQTVGVLGEVPGHPVENDADAGLVAAVDEVHEVVGGPEAGSRREVADHLVAPGAGERMLQDRQQLDVRVAHLLHVGDQRIRHLPVTQQPVVRPAHPGAEVDLIDRKRFLQPVFLGPRLHPFTVVPLIAVEVCDDRSRTSAGPRRRSRTGRLSSAGSRENGTGRDTCTCAPSPTVRG